MPRYENLSADKYCPYCHKYTSITPVSPNYTPAGRELICLHKNTYTKTSYWLGECHSCKDIMMILDYGRRVYPEVMPKPSDERIPEEIRYSLDEAKRCFEVDAYCASTVMSRRALEICCIDKGANKNRKLVEQIDGLVELGIITIELKDIAHTVRWIGNDGAHLNPNKVTREDAEAILNLTEQFFTIIYIAPAIAKERLEKRDKAKENREE